LYKAKNGDEFPRTILFKEDGEYFIASEAMK
ncbi:glutamyl-tRNA amidotransferase, partial [Listeria monocytogenes]|nr:glutamyl-tRNA amidotransferase [Listeria monocytogenes]